MNSLELFKEELKKKSRDELKFMIATAYHKEFWRALMVEYNSRPKPPPKPKGRPKTKKEIKKPPKPIYEHYCHHCKKTWQSYKPNPLICAICQHRTNFGLKKEEDKILTPKTAQ